jgi:rhomboid-like protein
VECAAYDQYRFKEDKERRAHQGTLNVGMGVDAETAIQSIKERYAALQARIKEFPALIKPWISLAFVAVMQPYADMTEGKRLCWKICLFNAAIYGFWKLRRLQPFMTRSFMHHPLSGLSYSMLTSTFRYCVGILHRLLVYSQFS